ncbi:hypothetical protein ACFW2V_13895 [Streptomyces sp. NPDC058947]|uniref:hypothetical protein n=1 Tax=Streptomyces sp. NPDC058947 TaxID=3346675 RepID=UPI0036823A55
MASINVREIEDLIQVGETSDSKDNPVVALEILGVPVLYARAEVLTRYDTEDWEMIFRQRLAGLLAGALLRDDDPQWWQPGSPTGREVRPLPSREG